MMRVEYINPFISAVTNTFSMMAGCEVERGTPILKRNPLPAHDISGVIGLSGKAIGAVVISLSKPLALKVASNMLMAEVSELDADVADAVGELTNMIAGSAKAELAEYQLEVSLPNVITGRDHEVHFPRNAEPLCVPFSSEWGELALEVGLTPVPAPVGV